MRVIIIGVLTYAAFVLRTVLPLVGSWASYAPRVDLAILLWVACRTGRTTGLLTAAVWGLISDALSQGPLGIDVLAYVLTAYCMQTCAARGWMVSPIATGVISGASAFITSLATGLLRNAPDTPALRAGELAMAAAGPAAATAVLVFLACESWSWIAGRPADGARSSSPEVANRWHMLTE